MATRDALPPECRPNTTKKHTKSKGHRKEKNTLTLEECELRIIRDSIASNDEEQGPALKRSPETARIYSILLDFLRKEMIVCYGGIAVNMNLPKSAQFYGPNDLPDYDAFSVNAVSVAKRLVDIYVARGFSDAEARSGVHLGTYKVFVNFIAILDLTDIPGSVFDLLEPEAVNKDRIRFASPTWLRMAMHLELSRPMGDVSRWEKVESRLQLLEHYHPWGKEGSPLSLDCVPKVTEPTNVVRKTLFQELVNQKAVFFGSNAVAVYQEQANLYEHVFRVIVEDTTKCANTIRTAMVGLVFDTTNKNKIKRDDVDLFAHPSVSDIVPEHVHVFVHGNLVAVLYQTTACYSYNEVSGDIMAKADPDCTVPSGKKARVATTDAAISLLIALAYVPGNEGPETAHKRKPNPLYLCMAREVHLAAADHRLDQSGIWRRFRLPCIGVQPTLETIRAKKAAVFRKLKGSTGEEYERWFLKYAPGVKNTTTKPITRKEEKEREDKEKEDNTENGVLAFLGMETKKKKQNTTKKNNVIATRSNRSRKYSRTQRL